jgi:hypothetical protein
MRSSYRAGFEEKMILVVVVAVGMWEPVSSISKVCGKGGKQQYRSPSFPSYRHFHGLLR